MKKSKVGVFICGVTGRIGSTIARLVHESNSFELLGATASPKDQAQGKDVGSILGADSLGVVVSKSLQKAVENQPNTAKCKPVVIDFSSTTSFGANAKTAELHCIPLMVGTTGLSAMQKKALNKASKKIPVLLAPNTSVGANIMFSLAKTVAKLLPEADVEISEVHHKGKKDSPSGTALRLAESVAKARKQELQQVLVLDRSKRKKHQTGEIGVFGLRGGSAKGDHTVFFFAENEHIELKHHVDDKGVFAEGALKAAKFLAVNKPGAYDMKDVLKIDKQ